MYVLWCQSNWCFIQIATDLVLRIRLCEYLRIANYYGRPSCSKCTVRRWITVISCTISARVCVQKLQQLDLEEPELEMVYFLCTFWTLFLCQTGGWGHFGRSPNLAVTRFTACWKSSWPPWIVHPEPRPHLMRALLGSGRHRTNRPTSEWILCAKWVCTVC